jgi:hypothetical protein
MESNPQSPSPSSTPAALHKSGRVRGRKRGQTQVEMEAVDAFATVDETFDMITQTENMLNPDQ